ncbi:MAG: hypothetical protein HY596_02575 [Candidatus Omnitrophica bacterium]|nr:hypothetical protein [Candidatus Omnitrophota bacterium]
MRLRRRPWILAGMILAGSLLCATLAASLWLAAWVPTGGRTWLERQLARALSLDVHVAAVRYSPWHGLLIEDLKAVDPATRRLWIHAPSIRMRIGLLSALLQRRLPYHATATVVAPCRAALTLTGRYRLHDRHLSMEMASAPFALDSLSPLLSQHLSDLTAGTVRLRLHADWQPKTSVTIRGRIEGAGLTWQRAAARTVADVRLEGTARALLHARPAWMLDVTAAVAHGRVEAPTALSPLSDVTGTVRFLNDTLQIPSLRGQALGSSWELDGTIGPFPQPSCEVRLRASGVPLDTVVSLWPRLRSWQPEGSADLVAIVRGPLASWPDIEVMTKVRVREASMSVPALQARLDHLTGEVEYDHLPRRLTLASLRGRLLDNPVQAHGAIVLSAPPRLNLIVDTEGEAGVWNERLAQQGPVQSVAGRASLHVELSGAPTDPRWQGRLTLADTRLLLRGVPVRLEAASGTIHFTNETITSERLSLVVGGEPVLLTGAITNLTSAPHLAWEAQLTDGRLRLDGTWQTDRFVLANGELALRDSHLRLQGQIASPSSASELSAAGTLNLSDLAHLPWVTLKQVEAWQLQGQTKLQGAFRGRLEDWRGAEIMGTATAERIMARGLPIEALRMEWQQQSGKVAIRIPQATVGGGRMTANFFARPQPEPASYLIETDVTAVDLANLAASVPSWKERQIRGSASAHASLVGTWGEPGSLRGDGWIHMSGEQLGELPLLDRLFRGVFGALADRLGLAYLRKARMTKFAGQWRLSQQRIWTEDVQLSGEAGAEPIVILIHGSVGLDKTLDLTIEPDLPAQLVVEAPNTSTVGRTIVKVMGGAERLRRMVGRHHLGGTLEKPQYKFEFNLR